MKASEWIDRVKKTTGIESDYGAAKVLGVSRATVSKYRSTTTTLDEDVAIRVAGALGERPEAVLLDQYAERTKAAAPRAALFEAARRLCILCSIGRAVRKKAATPRDSQRGALLANWHPMPA